MVAHTAMVVTVGAAATTFK
jgi:hypothetical protein